MSEELYELVALAARYWFTLLGVIIVWRSFSWLRKDRQLRHKRLRQLPDAGMIGEMVVLSGSDELPEGAVVPLPREGVIGRLRFCDLCLPVPGVAVRHAYFEFVPGEGLIVAPLRNETIRIDGAEVTRQTQNAPLMYHGSQLALGDAVLRMRLFMGLDASFSMPVRPDAPPLEEQPQDERQAAMNGDEPDYEAQWQRDQAIHHQYAQHWGDTAQYHADDLYQAEDGLADYEDENVPYEDAPYPGPEADGHHNAPYDEPEYAPPEPPASRERRGLFGRRRR